MGLISVVKHLSGESFEELLLIRGVQASSSDSMKRLRTSGIMRDFSARLTG